MEEIKIEKLRQIISRTDKTGNEKVEMLIKFTEEYHFAQMQLKNNCIKSDVINLGCVHYRRRRVNSTSTYTYICEDCGARFQQPCL